ncbi:MAG: long-chain fatty acid--CoA ligase [Nitrospirae bacterium]|nr:long-chain fatty acid--CoA ligase [Nitrospirota bacterium]
MILPWLRGYDAEVPPRLRIPEVPLHDFLLRAAWRSPRRPALIYYGRRISYDELENLSHRFAAALLSLGVRPGDRVAVHLPNIPQFVIAFYGILRMGGVAVPTNPLYVGRELEVQLKDAGAETIVTLDLFYETVREVRERAGLKRVIIARIQDFLPALLKPFYPIKAFREGHLVRHPRGEGIFSFVDLLDGAPEIRVSHEGKADDLAVLQYTGGTTGIPKGVMLTHRNLAANTLQCRHWLARAVEGGEIFLGAIPFFHAYGLTACMNLAVCLASPVILLPKFKTDEALHGIAKYRATVFIGVEAMYQALLNSPKLARYDLSSIRYCISGAGPLHAEVQERFETLTGGKLVEGYGLSEASPVTHSNPLYGTRKKGSIGLPFPNTEAKIVDPETGREDVPPGGVGELTIRGPQVMAGYWNRPEETAAVLRDGWLHTGDLARMDADGYFFIMERKKDMIKSGGENVYPREVEEILFRHPKVAEAVVVGMPDSFKGEAVKAVVVLNEGMTATPEEIIEFCKKDLARFKVPSVVEFCDELPKNILGKVLRREVRGG